MVFALETYRPATDGDSAARIEEPVVVTDAGHAVITRFPAEDLPIANADIDLAARRYRDLARELGRWAKALPACGMRSRIRRLRRIS